MQVFKLYFILLKKYKGSLILFASIFLFISLFLSGVFSKESDNSFVKTKLKIGIVNEDHGILAKEIKNYFKEDHNLMDIDMDEKEIVNELYWKRLDYVLVIPEGLEENICSGKTENIHFECIKVPGTLANELFETELRMYTSKLSTLVLAGHSLDEGVEELYRVKDRDMNVKLVQSVNKKQNDRLSRFLLYVPYLFISVSIIGIGTILLVFNKKEVKERMECSSTSMKERTLGMVAGILTFGAMLYVTVLVIGIILTKGSMLTDPRTPYFLVNLFVLLLFGLSLGFFVGVVARSRDSITGINNLLGLFLCMIGGIFVPMEFMGDRVREIGELLPTYWYMISNEKISAMIKATPEFIKEILLQSTFILCYTVAVFAVTMVILSVKRKRTA